MFCIVACMTDRPQMFAPTRGFLGMADSMEPCKNVVGPTLLAMATTFGINGEIQSPTGLSVCLSVTFYVVVKQQKLAEGTNRVVPRDYPQYQFGLPIPPLTGIIRIKDFACFRKPYVMFIISRSIRVRVTFTTAVRIACRYLHWINSNPNTDLNPHPNPSVPVYYHC